MASDQYVWLLWSSAFLVPWLLVYVMFPVHRRALSLDSTVEFGYPCRLGLYCGGTRDSPERNEKWCDPFSVTEDGEPSAPLGHAGHRVSVRSLQCRYSADGPWC